MPDRLRLLLLFLARLKVLAHIVVMVVAEMYKKLVSEIHYLDQAVPVLLALHFKRKRKHATPVGTGDLAALAVHAPVLGQAIVVALFQKTLYVFLNYRLRRNIGQKIFEGHASLGGIHNQMHSARGQP